MTKKLTKKNVTQLLVAIQDHGDIYANSLATQAIEDFGLEREHQRQTKEPKESYTQKT